MKEYSKEIAHSLAMASERLMNNDSIGCNQILNSLIADFTPEYMIQESEYVVFKRREIERFKAEATAPAPDIGVP